MRLVLRSILRRPIVPCAVVTTTGLAIAANTALFSIVDGLLFRPLPYREADRIVHLQLEPSEHRTRTPGELHTLLQHAADTAALEQRADARPALLFDPTSSAVTEWQLRPAFVSESMFELLGVTPLYGRALRAEDFESPPFTVLLGYGVWTQRFGSDPSVVGRSISIPGTSVRTTWRVIGVMPRGFEFPDATNLWVPAYSFYARPRVLPYARLSPGTTIASIRAELPGVRVTPLRERVRPRGAFAFAMLLVGTALLLVVALVQVAGLLLSRVTARISEIGVCLALGASRLMLARHFALEGAVIVIGALVIASLLSVSLTKSLIRMLPAGVTAGQHLLPDARTFFWSFVGAGFSVLLLTVLPIDVMRRASPLALLQGHLVRGAHLRSARLQQGLVVVQLATVTALVYLSALTYRSFALVGRVDVGFDLSGLYAITMPRGDDLAQESARARLTRQRELVAETIERLAALEGIQAVAGAHFWPMQPAALSDDVFPSNFDPSGHPIAGKYAVVTLGFPRLLGLRVTSGGEPSVAELIAIGVQMPPGQQLALVNRSLARQLERFGPPVGQVVGGRFRITGVLPDVSLEAPDRPVQPTLFHYLPPPAAPAIVLVRLEPGRSLADTGIPVLLSRIWGRATVPVVPLSEALDRATSEYRARAVILALIALLMLPLAMLGLIGGVAFDVRQRTKEIAIRVALGADARSIERRIVARTLALAAIGLSVGLFAGIGFGALIRATLFGVDPVDWRSLLATAILAFIIVAGTAFVPAHRAGRLSPIDALREV